MAPTTIAPTTSTSSTSTSSTSTSTTSTSTMGTSATTATTTQTQTTTTTTSATTTTAATWQGGVGCASIADNLQSTSCEDVLGSSSGFTLKAGPSGLRFNGYSFDDNAAISAGIQNVCMLAAFGNGGRVMCVPKVISTASYSGGNQVR